MVHLIFDYIKNKVKLGVHFFLHYVRIFSFQLNIVSEI